MAKRSWFWVLLTVIAAAGAALAEALRATFLSEPKEDVEDISNTVKDEVEVEDEFGK